MLSGCVDTQPQDLRALNQACRCNHCSVCLRCRPGNGVGCGWKRCRVWQHWIRVLDSVKQNHFFSGCMIAIFRSFIIRMFLVLSFWEGEFHELAHAWLNACILCMHAHDHVIQVLGHEIQFMREHFDAWVYQSECSCIKYDMFRPTPKKTIFRQTPKN